MVEPRPLLGINHKKDMGHKRDIIIINNLCGSSPRQIQKAVKISDRGFGRFHW
jgi:hypothetical protein